MAAIIGKVVFGKDALNFGLELCLSKAGLKAFSVNESTAKGCDILLVSMFWYKNVYELRLFLEKAGIKKGSGSPWVLAGGMQATMTPEIIAEFVDFVFVGDADNHLADVVSEIFNFGTCTHPNIYSSGMPCVPPPAVCKPSAYAITTNSDDGGTYRCEIARGCKYKCAFCCLSGLKPYQEVSFDELHPVIKSAGKKRASFFAPERTCHSEWIKIKEAIKINGCHDMGQDARLEHLQEIEHGGVTFGLEGLSERLRRSIGKPFSDEMIIERLGKFVSTRKNIARVSVYFIAGLPGEDDSDWIAVRDLFEKINQAEWSRRLVLCPVLNPLSPKPFTRLKDAHIDLFADYGKRWSSLLRRDGGQWGFRVVETLVWGPLERTMDVIIQRGGVLGAEVVKQLPVSLLKSLPPVAKRKSFAKYVLDICQSNGLTTEQLEM